MTAESPYQRWVGEEREAWEANCARQRFERTDEYWTLWLEVKAFSLIEQAQTLLLATIDPDDTRAGAFDEATDRVIAEANSLRTGPVYSTTEVEGDIDAIEARIAELRNMPYDEFLASPEWQLQRKAALRRTGGRCQACNRQARLHVHHRSYERRGDEGVDDLLVCAKRATTPFTRTAGLTALAVVRSEAALVDEPHPRAPERAERRRLLDAFDLIALTAVA